MIALLCVRINDKGHQSHAGLDGPFALWGHANHSPRAERLSASICIRRVSGCDIVPPKKHIFFAPFFAKMAPQGARSPSPPLLVPPASQAAFVSSRRPTLVLNRHHTYRGLQRVPPDQPAPRSPRPHHRPRRIRPGAQRRGGQSRSPFHLSEAPREEEFASGGGPHPFSCFASAVPPLPVAHAHQQLGPFIPHVCLSISGYYYPCVPPPFFQNPTFFNP